MASFIVTYDTHRQRNYQNLYDGMKNSGGVRLAESVWGLDSTASAAAIRDWLRSLLDNDDTIVVLQFRPTLDWGSVHASPAAVAWLQARVKAYA